MNSILQVLRSPAFLEKLLLLLVAAAITGLLVPEVSARLAEARFRRQKTFEADLQRQRDIITAQSELLKKIASLLWEFQLANINVSFYKTNGNESAFTAAASKYQTRSVELLGQIRAELSTARRLVSPAMCERLSRLYFGTLLQVDARLELLMSKGQGASREEWLQQHDNSFGGAQKEIDDRLKELAVEFDLAAPLAAHKDT